ncbi:hypothetical protein GF373_10005, partial [bacterium]|nr:hypothetical protein [bacterium]
MNSRRNCVLLSGVIFLMLISLPAVSGVQYSNDFENPSSIEPSEAWPEWVDISTGAAVEAVNGRIEWKESGNHWLRLDQELPEEYVVEFDFFFERGGKDRFSFWPIAGEETVDIWERHHYFLRDNTHFFSFSDTVPSEGERDLTLPLGSDPHRMRAEVKGDHVALLYKDQGKGGWILIDERDFPAHGEGPKYVQLGMQGASPLGLNYIDNFVLSYREENIFSYSNDFEDPSSSEPSEAWPELLDISTGAPVEAVNGRIEWKETGNHWLRLDKALPNDYIVEFDFFFERGTKDRFSFWPIAGEETVDIWERHHYFLRDNTHYFSFSDTVPSEGERDLTLPLGTPPHRIRAEVSGDHVLLLYKDQGEGGWILIDERDFPPHGDGPRYVQLGMHGGSPMGLNYIDNLVVRGVSANRAVVERDIQADEFNAEEIIPVSLNVEVTGVIPSIEIIEGFPKGWHVSDISEGGVVSDGAIIWSLKNLSATTVLTYNAMPPKLIFEEDAGFSGSVDSGDGA